MNTRRTSRQSAFSLVEILAVIAIIGVLTAIAIPSTGHLQRAMNLNRAGQMLGDTLASARQEASGKNRNVELRIIELADPPGYRAFQTWVANEQGVLSPLGKVVTLPDGLLISSEPSLSPLLTASPDLSGTAGFGGHGNRPFAALRIRAGGLPDPSINETNNFLTIRSMTDTAVPPVNFYTLRLDHITGRLTIHRP